jgi:hypothetical protein
MSYFIQENKQLPYLSGIDPVVHFTKYFDNLIHIIDKGFRYSYSEEYLADHRSRRISACFPMVSFCFGNAGTLMNQIISYGTYAIALKNSWAKTHKLSPVLYLDNESTITATVLDSFDTLNSTYSDFEIDIALRGGKGYKSEFAKLMIEIFKHSKNVNGPLIRGETLIDPQYPFIFENEWRHILINPTVKPFLLKSEIIRKSDFNKKIENFFLEFSGEDIEAIIIEEDWQKEEVINCLVKKFGNTIEFASKIYFNPTRLEWDEG